MSLHTHAHTYFVAEEWGDRASARSDWQHGDPGALAVQSWRSLAAPGASPQLQSTQPRQVQGDSCTGVLAAVAVNGFWFTVG